MEKILTVRDVAGILALCPESIRRLARARKLTGIKYGNKDWRFKESREINVQTDH